MKIINSSEKFSLSEQASLGGIPIKPTINQPRALDKEGKPRFDLFVFYPKQVRDLNQFKEGQMIVKYKFINVPF